MPTAPVLAASTALPLKILVAEDDPVAQRVLVQALRALGHEEPLIASDGEQAWRLWQEDPVRVIVSDWSMPRLDGLQLCQKVRASADSHYTYFILLTGREATGENEREAADAGVDDFLNKPLVMQELWMRLRVAERILKFATQVRQLEAFLPICSYCKKVRDDHNYWQQIEHYINTRTGTDFSHSICPECYQNVVTPQLEKLRLTMANDAGAAAGRPKPHVGRKI